MSNVILTVEPLLGSDIKEVITSMIHIATVNHVCVYATFNGFKLHIREDTDPDTVYLNYDKFLRRIV